MHSKRSRNLSVQENKFLKEKENFDKETKDLNWQLIELKLQVEEQKRIVFVTKEELSSKDRECTRLMNEVVSYRRKL